MQSQVISSRWYQPGMGPGRIRNWAGFLKKLPSSLGELNAYAKLVPLLIRQEGKITGADILLLGMKVK